MVAVVAVVVVVVVVVAVVEVEMMEVVVLLAMAMVALRARGELRASTAAFSYRDTRPDAWELCGHRGASCK